MNDEDDEVLSVGGGKRGGKLELMSRSSSSSNRDSKSHEDITEEDYDKVF